MLLKGKHILLGVTGGIAAYKSAALASALTKQGAHVNTILTKNAQNFITPLTFEGVTGERCFTDTFDRQTEFRVPHIKLAQQADLVIIAPASANTIAKIAHGIADDMLTSTLLACTCPKIIAPAMNTAMFENIATQENIQTLRRYGWVVAEPATGHLACGDNGRGKMLEPEVLAEFVYNEIAEKKDMDGLHVLITAGPTQEAIDPVRYITNHSTGKMGYQLAINAARRGANVTLITGSDRLSDPMFTEVIHVKSAQEMYDAVTNLSAEQDILVFAAAVADYRPAKVEEEKIKKQSNVDLSSIPLVRTSDILQTVGNNKKSGQIICGFSMETQNLLENSRKKLIKKNADLICANSLRTEGAGFGVDTNVITLITKDSAEELPLMSKYDTSRKIWDTLIDMRNCAKNQDFHM